MKVALLQGSIVGSKTRTALQYVETVFKDKYPDIEVTMLDLANYNIPFSDGRNYLEYTGDAGFVTKTLMESDAIVVGTPIFQASMPATLKNIFDLLPEQAFQDKVVSIVVTAGSSKHYLIPETQIKPIISYMKGQLTQSYVFIEEKDFYRKEIMNDDIHFRIERLIEDTVSLTHALRDIRTAKEAEYGF
ncbi:NADPH-dependent FMN reductase [Oceanobacillus alkalisoli]|uniref:NADPH-dependent FMN reductase n=1 Tax=Oceanobacillus alkalisoli TaxID=2925113 RepID=UPI001EF0A587|nr:NADPH-dependent FMN reductase [Oceanobacillus alkalisoli]MCF3942133.1 NAD(P)H-dependent oxidoreductase [Oceanobacillus alkalisoli]MCG5105002.1 NAD(P)H-dependent oxidoreductase [Oceanobacillus alkalisoli]